MLAMTLNISDLRIEQSRPTWQAALLVFIGLAAPVFVVLTLLDWMLWAAPAADQNGISSSISRLGVPPPPPLPPP